MKVSFIIVSWNVRELLKRCLLSIRTYAKDIPHEIIVIDNGSSDGSADMVQKEFSTVKLIANEGNRGFGAACNQGIASARGEYIFLFNPDSTLGAGALDRLTSYMDAHADVGVCAPQILNGDSSTQKSIRRFPTPLSQLLILLKLRRFASHIPPLRKYFALDFDYLKDEQEIDQPMGAAMLIRACIFQKVGVFDERFFLWFEEVDLCKRIKDNGYRIVYIASAHIVHSSGKSFAQQSIIERQKNFFRSCGYYLKKQCGVLGLVVGTGMTMFAWLVETYQLIARVFPLSFFHENLAPVRTSSAGFSKNIFMSALAAIVSVELVSFAGYLVPPVTAVGFGVVTVSVFVLALWKLEYGVAAALTELIIGSKGHLLSINVGTSVVSLRIALFVVLFIAWVIYELRLLDGKGANVQSLGALFRGSKLLRLIWGMLFIVLFGIANGIVQGNTKDLIYADANAWLFFLLAPCLYRAFRDRGALLRLLSALSAGMTAQIIKVLLAFYVMGHKGFGIEGLTIFYRWIRSTGVGEITQLSNLYRVFFQSQIYVVVFLCTLSFILLYRLKNTPKISKEHHVIWLLMSGAFASLIVSFSRSFWLGTAVVALLMFGGAVRQLWRKGHTVLVWGALHVSAIIGAILLLVGISLIPIPSSRGAFYLDALSDRVKDVQSEAAAASRWNLFPILVDTIAREPFIGYGFGKEVTYVSRDPRVLLANPRGEYTTYAFEWGYLDILVKLGLVGFFAYGLFLRELLKQGVKALATLSREGASDISAIVSGLLFGVAAVMVVHFFTPYLNHPLGIGLLVFTGLFFERFSAKAS